MSPAGQKKLAAVGALLIAGGVLTYIAFGGIEENIVYFLSPGELIAKGEKAHGAQVRLGGLVQTGSYKWDNQTLDLRFNCVDVDKPDSPAVLVKASGAPPQMFREGIGVVVEGTFDGKLFSGDRVLVKHSNEYRPPAEGEKPADLYKTLVTN